MTHICESLPAPWGWTPERGPIPGVYLDKAPGSRFFGAARWVVGPGGRDAYLDVLKVEGPTDQMPIERLLAEARNIVEGGLAWADHLGRELVAFDAENGNRRPVEALVDEARRRYAECIAPWAVADLIGVPLMGYPQRPGWELLPADLDALKRAKPQVGIWRRG